MLKGKPASKNKRKKKKRRLKQKQTQRERERESTTHLILNMEIFGTTGLFIDHLLDFSSDIQDEDDGDSSNNNHHSSKPSNPRLTESDSLSMLIEEEEEELEWLLNRDIFPPVETSDILCENKTKNHSPVSVLGSGSFQVPVQARSKRRRKRRNFSDLSGQQWWWFEPKKKRAEALAMTTSSFIRKCQHCQTEETPQWRAGPLGPKTLCNACGVRYKSGRLLPEYRPANSPTFSSRLHSNSHRKVLDMRRQKQKDILPLLDKRLVG